MPKKEEPLAALAHFMPEGTFDAIAPYFKQHTIHLTLTHHRRSLHGDYRSPSRSHPFHRISVNATLNPYSFLITLLHELAHLTTTVQYGNKASPHGLEWKQEFRKALIPVIGKNIFPADVEAALKAYIHNPAASTCTDPKLYKALVRYDKEAETSIHADEVPIGGQFELGKRTFVKLEELRTRSRCKEVATGRIYFVQGIALVKPIDTNIS
jgi:SprT protein